MSRSVEIHGERTPEQIGGGIRVTVGRRWIRVAVYYGSPPGSHIGFWRTRVGGLLGLNLRIGRRYLGPCLTVLVHTKTPEDYLRRNP